MDIETIRNEIEYKAIRSSGPGGQHVNKVATKAQLTFTIATSEALIPEEKEILFTNLRTKITKAGLLILQYGNSRSFQFNKEALTQKLIALLEKALEKKKPRKATKPSFSSIQKRIEKKKQTSIKKANRKKPLF